MTEPIRWGIAGPGRMAAAIVPEFHQSDNAELVAVGSRSAERAEVFATEHGIPRWHSSYEALVEDPAVQAIYIATPHPQHTDIALAAIAAGKAVLVEKAADGGIARQVADPASADFVSIEPVWQPVAAVAAQTPSTQPIDGAELAASPAAAETTE